MPLADTGGGTSDEDLAAILENASKPEDGLKMTGDAKPEAPVAAPEPPSWNGKDFEFEYRGQKIFPDSREKALTWLSQGHNYSQRAAEFNRKESEYTTKISEAQKRLEALQNYAQVDQYAAQNKDWWAHVQEAFQNRGQQAPTQGDPQFQALLKPFEDKLSGISTFVESLQAERQAQQKEKADTALDQEVASIRKEFPNIDMAAKDESGQTLEYRVMEHAGQIGTGSFRAAFRDYLFPQLLEHAKSSKVLEGQRKDQANAKAGILGKSPTPTAKVDRPVSVRGKSYSDIEKLIHEELGITA